MTAPVTSLSEKASSSPEPVSFAHHKAALRDTIQLYTQTVKRVVKLFLILSRPHLFSRSSLIQLSIIIVLSLFRSYIFVLFSYSYRDITGGLGDPKDFLHNTFKWACLLAFSAPFITGYRYFQEMYSLRWRRVQTKRMLNDYMSRDVCYAVGLSKSLSNVDARFADDIQTFTDLCLSLMLRLFNSVLDFFSFSYVIFNIYPAMYPPLIVYSFFGTFITYRVSKKMLVLQLQQAENERTFRSGIHRISNHGESIAFFNSSQTERGVIMSKFDVLCDNSQEMYRNKAKISLFTTIYGSVTSLLPVLLVAPVFMSGNGDMSTFMQAQGAFSRVLDSLNIFVNELERFGDIRACVERIAELERVMYGAFGLGYGDQTDRNATEERLERLKTLTEAEGENKHTDGSDKEIVKRSVDETPGIVTRVLDKESALISLRNVALQIPNGGQQLFRNVTFSVREGEKVLITGRSGIGKSSMLRAIAGLWKSGKGTISRPVREELLFLPQRAYCTIGSLRAQVAYPKAVDDAVQDDDVGVMNALRVVGLEDLPDRVGGLDKSQDWDSVLSGGEMQRVAFARVIYSRPKFVFLDECSSALDLRSERRLYEWISQHGEGIGIISVGHRESLKKYHDIEIQLGGGENEDGVEIVQLGLNREAPVQ